MKKTKKNYLVGMLPFTFFLVLLSCNSEKRSTDSLSKNEGEFSHRYNMVVERMKGDTYEPIFTKEFLLADVNIDIDNPRRFYNYSGDLSGRYIEVFSSHCQHEDCTELSGFVQEVLSYQKPDGRFGDSELIFSEEYIDKEHTPLLWGNGRMLVGLMEYYQKFPDAQVLEAARKLGDFFKGTYMEVTPKVVKRLEGMGAAGTICFTQWTEPLVMLSKATGNPEYADIAAKVYPTLPPRGIQHSHGYLSTMRGVLMLYEYTQEITHFNYVKEAYQDLVNSDDLTIYGSVKEYFGGKGGRDEGCSTVDFIRLSLYLYNLTGEESYLDRAEFAMYNGLYFNQFFTGDFGHHFIDHTEAYSKIVNAAWWCCTMSGMRALQVIGDEYFVKKDKDGYNLNFYIESNFSDEQLTLSLKRGNLENDYHSYQINVENILPGNSTLKLRIPPWAEDFFVLLNGKELEKKQVNNYFELTDPLQPKDRIDVLVKYETKVILPDKTTLKLNDIVEPVKGALCYGPYIMTIDNKLDFTFLAEPSNNQIYLRSIKNAASKPEFSNAHEDSYIKDAYLTIDYKHAGFPSYMSSVMRPISEMTFDGHPYMKVSHLFLPVSYTDSALKDNNTIDPWVD